MYRLGNICWDIELGVWGIIRVLDKELDCLVCLKFNLVFNIDNKGDLKWVNV